MPEIHKLITESMKNLSYCETLTEEEKLEMEAEA